MIRSHILYPIELRVPGMRETSMARKWGMATPIVKDDRGSPFAAIGVRSSEFCLLNSDFLSFLMPSVLQSVRVRAFGCGLRRETSTSSVERYAALCRCGEIPLRALLFWSS